MPEFTVPAPQSSFSNPLPPTPPTPPLPPEPKTNWFKILLLSLAGLTIIFGLVAVGIWCTSRQRATGEHIPTIEEPAAEEAPAPESAPFTPIGIRDTFWETRLDGVRYAFVRGGNIWVHKDWVEDQITQDAVPAGKTFLEESSQGFEFWKVWYSDPEISPDGQKVAFLKNSAGIYTSELYVVDFDGGEPPRRLSDDGDRFVGDIQWSSGSDEVFYVSEVKLGSSAKIFSAKVIGGEKEERGSFPFDTGCGGGSPNPSTYLYMEEIDNPFFSGLNIRSFQLSPNDNLVLHNTSCSLVGVALLNLLTGEDVLLDERLSSAIFSPSGSRVAGVLNGGISLFDLSGKEISSIGTSETPLTLFWPEGEERIYFTTKVPTSSLEFSRKLAVSVCGYYPCGYDTNKFYLWSVKADGTEERRLCEVDSYGLKILQVLQGGAEIIFSDVENPVVLYNWVNRSGGVGSAVEQYPNVNVLVWEARGVFSAVDEAEQASLFVPD